VSATSHVPGIHSASRQTVGGVDGDAGRVAVRSWLRRITWTSALVRENMEETFGVTHSLGAATQGQAPR
ncbi:hypothetical protein, partial [Natrinema soli]